MTLTFHVGENGPCTPPAPCLPGGLTYRLSSSDADHPVDRATMQLAIGPFRFQAAAEPIRFPHPT